MASRCSSTTRPCNTRRKACRCSSWRARNTDRVRRAIGPPRGCCCSVCAPVIAESFERIHRTNLVGMGVLPLQFQAGESAASLQLTGEETYHIEGVATSLNGAGRTAGVRAVKADGAEIAFTAVGGAETPPEGGDYSN